jgi:hypothetical protein
VESVTRFRGFDQPAALTLLTLRRLRLSNATLNRQVGADSVADAVLDETATQEEVQRDARLRRGAASLTRLTLCAALRASG